MQDRLNNLRTTFTYIASFVVLSFGVIMFEFMDNPKIQFLLVALIAQVIGTLTSIFFMWFIREKKLAVDNPRALPYVPFKEQKNEQKQES
jgi:Na+/melibiose symporter-like transporter